MNKRRTIKLHKLRSRLCVSSNKANLFLLRSDAIPKQKFDAILMSLLSIVEHNEALVKISQNLFYCS